MPLLQSQESHINYPHQASYPHQLPTSSQKVLPTSEFNKRIETAQITKGPAAGGMPAARRRVYNESVVMTVLQLALCRCASAITSAITMRYETAQQICLILSVDHETSKLRKSEVAQDPSLLFLAHRQTRMPLRIPKHGTNLHKYP